jgi:hypothetical protein
MIQNIRSVKLEQHEGCEQYILIVTLTGKCIFYDERLKI